MTDSLKDTIETDWSRTTYTKSSDGTLLRVHRESKLASGEAHVSLEHLVNTWSDWSEDERIDFCNSYSAAPTIEPSVVQFLSRNSDSLRLKSAVASMVARTLIKEEALAFLNTAMDEAPLGQGSNILQALMLTGYEGIHSLLKERCRKLSEAPSLTSSAIQGDSIVFEYIWCLRYRLKLGVAPHALKSCYESLMTHQDERVRRHANQHLSPWFEAPDKQQGSDRTFD
jgi:hypothetical protein